ncbi:NAD(P)H-quinone dehydrogenase [Tessaracoccus sp. MC1865]|uniref:NAD(P)H-quinone dehydrogenase n=1 Tax=unclassified Tessaracoccus TaxID=2635419 RepID=UPI0015FF13A3|nr:NAD(P)H-quinone dehydrogenase [Tessaracoccus sp. MC1865]MBB1484531.1 NAD(P)H-quinone dehydrogenase [Tessaracoccus sp. MC1865]MBB1509401.1 NAD(P)H-quinone dehydrogenase [Tessaracoccus sp. MC1756]QTO38371.1 NAD(P)H-quinone dehydrogenase [Tessaracoccus sp. MC1865]
MTKVVIIGGGPGGYEAALVGNQLGGEVTLIERDGLGGAAVLSDCVPSKTLIATAEVMVRIKNANQLGLHIQAENVREVVKVDLAEVNERVLALAKAQSDDIAAKLRRDGVQLVTGQARLDGANRVVATTEAGEETFEADIVLVATGTTPRELPDARCDGERILNWKQVYNLTDVPERLIVVGSGVTGAEFASAYDGLGCEVVLVSSRKQVLPGEDQDAAAVLQRAFERRGMQILSESRAVAARRQGDGVVVTLEDGREVEGSHCLLAVGAIPNSAGLGLEEVGVELGKWGHIPVDRVSRTSHRNIYAAGDVTGVFALASVAAMQGRIAMWHSLGDAVAPLDMRTVSSNVFTTPEIATVGVTQKAVDAGEVRVASVLLPLAPNARSKMMGFTDGFVKLFCLPTTGIIIGGVVVAPRASELIHAVSLAVAQKITVDEFSHAFTVYPSMSGSIAEAARRLHNRDDPLMTQ